MYAEPPSSRQLLACGAAAAASPALNGRATGTAGGGHSTAGSLLSSASGRGQPSFFQATQYSSWSNKCLMAAAKCDPPLGVSASAWYSCHHGRAQG